MRSAIERLDAGKAAASSSTASRAGASDRG